MFQVFLAVLKITPALYVHPHLLKVVYLFTNPPFYCNPPSLTSNLPTIRHGKAIETRDDKLHVKFDNSENLKNLKK